MAFGGQSGHYGRSNRLPSKGLNGDKQLRINNIRRICEAAGFPRFRLLEPVPHLLVDCLKARMATLYAFLMSWYQHSARDESGERFKAGRNDLFMASYLPYCDVFVTAEIKREQEKCLKELAAVLNLRTEVLAYDDFIKRL
jgi:hypothetical protein